MNRRVFLMSIKPQYVERILDGQKRFELRKQPLRASRGDIVVIYSSSPTKAVEGAFMVLGAFSAPKEQLWRKHRADLGIAEDAYQEYFADHADAFALAIGRIVRVPRVPLDQLRSARPGFVPPQSYMYCPEQLSALIPTVAWAALGV